MAEHALLSKKKDQLPNDSFMFIPAGCNAVRKHLKGWRGQITNCTKKRQRKVRHRDTFEDIVLVQIIPQPSWCLFSIPISEACSY